MSPRIEQKKEKNSAQQNFMRKAVTGTNKECQEGHHKHIFKYGKMQWMWTAI
jgi:hypothetical protein